ncbi:MAG: N-acetylmuramoyl-L-alanine amidase-like domain-containing protein [Thermodesulfovibrionales bacterium]
MGKYISYNELIHLGKWTPEQLDSILQESVNVKDIGLRIKILSTYFLETPYQESTLIGNTHTREVFIINLEGVDCFAFLDYIEAMRLSSSFKDFKENLKRLRYKDGQVSFEKRNHFFTDWIESNSDYIINVTEQIGCKAVISSKKTLNEKDDGTLFLPGIQSRERIIHYIPANVIDDLIINALKTGDYIGIYSTERWLDVSHVGIFIQDGGAIYLRHASLKKKKVIDEDFKEYITGKPGIIIIRSRNDKSYQTG